MNTPIYNQLSKLKKQGKTPFHMPGHKRKCKHSTGHIEDLWAMDITEITGYDDLHHPQGMIRKSMDNLKKIYHTKESWYLVNGSTVGILAAISAVCSPGDKIVIGRNCHKAVYHAVRLLRLHAIYLNPRQSEAYDILLDVGEAEQNDLKKIIKDNPDMKAVVLTSPTYEGVVTDIAAICAILSEQYAHSEQSAQGEWDCKDNNRRPVLIVDEAHGAHMYFHDAFPESAIECGADIVIQSTHKTLPSLTQTALLHLCSDRVSAQILSEWLSMYESSSPSYLLMASAEYGVMFMNEQREKVQEYVDNLGDFRRKCGQLARIHVIKPEELPVYDYDIGKLVFSVKEKSEGGKWLFAMLRDTWNIELEMESRTYVIAMTSVMDQKEDFDALWEALEAIDRELAAELADGLRTEAQTELKVESGMGQEYNILVGKELPFHKSMPVPEKCMEPWELDQGSVQAVPLEASEGKIAASYVMLYPPGIPLLVPGEKINKEMVENLKFYLYNGYNVQGLSDGGIPVQELL